MTYATKILCSAVDGGHLVRRAKHNPILRITASALETYSFSSGCSLRKMVVIVITEYLDIFGLKKYAASVVCLAKVINRRVLRDVIPTLLENGTTIIRSILVPAQRRRLPTLTCD